MVVGLFWVLVGIGRWWFFLGGIFWVLVGDGGYFLGGGRWWWVVVGGSMVFNSPYFFIKLLNAKILM